MLWDTKQEINEIYQNNITKQFFLQELIENIKIEDETKKEETLEEYESKLPENLPHTSKYKLEQIESQLKNVIHDGYDYSDYASRMEQIRDLLRRWRILIHYEVQSLDRI